MCLCPALLRNTAGFFLFARENSGYLLNFAEVTRKKKRQLNGGCRNIAFIYNIYVRRTSRCENWHFSKCGDIQRRICYAFVIAWLHCFHIWVCQYLASKQRHATLSFWGGG